MELRRGRGHLAAVNHRDYLHLESICPSHSHRKKPQKPQSIGLTCRGSDVGWRRGWGSRAAALCPRGRARRERAARNARRIVCRRRRARGESGALGVGCAVTDGDAHALEI